MPPASVSKVHNCANVVSGAIARAYGGAPYAAKRLAADADAPVCSAKRWVRGANIPSAEALIRAMRRNRRLREEMWREIDPDVARFRIAVQQGVRK